MERPEDIEQRIKLTYESNAKEVGDDIDGLVGTQDKLSDSSANVEKAKKKETRSMLDSADAVSKNGGAMGILNELTGGLAMTVKDAFEAMELFTVAKEVDTAVTKTNTASTISNNTATQTAILGKIKNAAAWVGNTIATAASTVATGAATAAQWLWNTAILANPLVAFVVAIAATVAAIYKLTTFLIDSSKANDAAAAATVKNTAALKKESQAAEQSTKALEVNNSYRYDMAKASGASAEALRNLAIKLANEEVALAQNNAVTARNTFLRERNALALLQQSGASDEVIASQKKLTQSAYDEFTKQNADLQATFDKRRGVRNQNSIEEAAEATKKRDDQKAAEIKKNDELAAIRKKANEDAKKTEEDRAKERDDLARARGESARDEYENLQKTIGDTKKKNDDALKTENELKTEQENARFAALKQKMIDAGLSTIEIEAEHKRNLAALNDEYYAAESDKSTVRDAKQKEADDKKAAEKIQTEQNIQDAIRNINESGAEILDSLEALGLKKSKATQAIRKGIALSQIAADSAQAISKAIPMALEAGKEAASIAGPAAPVVGPLVTAASLAGSFATVASNVARAKSILSGGSALGGGGGGATTTTAPTGSSAAPQVSFQSSKENQISSSIIASQKDQPPVEAFIVESSVSTALELSRKKITGNSI